MQGAVSAGARRERLLEKLLVPKWLRKNGRDWVTCQFEGRVSGPSHVRLWPDSTLFGLSVVDWHRAACSRKAHTWCDISPKHVSKPHLGFSLLKDGQDHKNKTYPESGTIVGKLFMCR